jgi:hypothetical protein
MNKENKYTKRKTENVKIKEGVEPIEGTPFNSVEINEKFAITLGKNVLKFGFETREDAEKYVQGLPWEIILIAAACYTEFVTKHKE